SFMTRYFSSTEPFAPIVEYMIALRRLRFEAAEADGRTAVAAALAAVILRNDRRFIINSFGYRGVSRAGRGCQWERGCLVLEQPHAIAEQHALLADEHARAPAPHRHPPRRLAVSLMPDELQRRLCAHGREVKRRHECGRRQFTMRRRDIV